MFKYEIIANYIINGIKTNKLNNGDKLKSLRQISSQFNCSLSVALQAYEFLELQGYIFSVQKSGYYVSNTKCSIIPEPQNYNHSLIAEEAKPNNYITQILDMSSDSNIIPLGAAIPDKKILSYKKIEKIISSLLKNNPDILYKYTKLNGSQLLCEELAKYMFYKNVLISKDEIVITNGCMEALNISIRTVLREGDTVAIETPVFFSLIALLNQLKINVIEVPTKADTGIDLEMIEKLLIEGKIKSIIFSSTFQNPLCSVMPYKNKIRLIELLNKYNITAIEDDIYGDCSFSEIKNSPVKSLDLNDRVIYCSSFSKTLAPGLRVGWVINKTHNENISKIKFNSTFGGSLLSQETIGLFLKNGNYQIHLKNFRKQIFIQTMRIRNLIELHFPKEIKISNPIGGYFLWIEFQNNIDSYKIFHQAYKKSIGIVPGPLFSSSGKYLNCIRISCGVPVDEKIEQAIKDLGNIIKNL